METHSNRKSFIDSPSIQSSYPNYVDINGRLTIDRSGFNVNQSVQYTNKNWMNYIDNSRTISQLSIPGTHGSMALYGSILGHILINQTMNLDIQLNSGIRYIDIRCRHYYNSFPIHHDLAFQDAYFNDVLDSVINFLKQNPSETILMKVQEEIGTGAPPEGNTRTFNETFNSYLKGNEHYFWTPTNNSSNPINPTLGEVRGKIILLQNFPGSRQFGIDWDWLYVHDMWELDGSSQIYAKWEKVRDHFFRAMQNRNQIFVTHLSANGRISTLGDPRPWFVASGFADRENNGLADQLSSNPSSNWPDNPRYHSTSGPIFYGGTNVLTTRRIRDGRFTHTGIIAADFPGKGLIDGTIALNFPGTLSGDFQIVTALNNSSVLDLNGINNVTLWPNNEGNHQRWNFTYDRSENAYVIRSVSNSNLALAWDTSSPNRNVFATPIGSLRQNEYFWILEKNGDGYIFKNKYNPNSNMVLTVVGEIHEGANIQMSERVSGNAQIFFNRLI